MTIRIQHFCQCDPCTCGAAKEGDAQHVASGHRSVRRPRRATRTCERAPSIAEPALGAHLITPRRGYTHHGIYAGDGSVLHYSGLSRGIRRGPVETVALSAFANGKPVYVACRNTQPLEAQGILARARSRLGENRYRLLTNNCEHFAEWSRYGESRSTQVERWLGLVGGGFLLNMLGGSHTAAASI